MSRNHTHILTAALCGLLSLSMLTGCLAKKPPLSVSEDSSLIQPSDSSCPDEGILPDSSFPLESSVPETENESGLDLLRARIAESGALVGAAYLGCADSIDSWLDSPEADSLRGSCGFLWDIPASDKLTAEGNEIYLLLPRTTSDSVQVDAQTITEDGSIDIETVYEKTGGTPILLQGNISEIVPSFLVRLVTEEDMMLEYTPCLSLENGELYVPAGSYVLNLSHTLSIND